MRSTIFMLAWMLALAGCLGSEQPCEARPDDPLCQLADAGPSDASAPDTN